MKNPHTSSITVRASIPALLILMAVLPSAAYAQTLFDDTFNNADWITTLIAPTGSPPNAQVQFPTAPSMQDQLNGNLAPSRTTTHQYQGVIPPGIWVAHLYQPVSSHYNPATQGPIAAINFSYDLSPPTESVTYGLIIFQNNTYYRSNPPDTPVNAIPNPPGWKSVSHSNLTAANFVDVNDPSDSRHPDFSCKGSIIQFGYLTANSNTPDTKSAIDNWRVDITKGNACCGAIAKPEIRCNKGGGFTYNFDVTNNSTNQTQYVLLSPPQGATYTISPSIINTSLNPGQSTSVSVNITNASPTGNVCIDVALADKEVKPCCKLTTCVRAPECACLKRLKEGVECGSGGSYTYTAQLQNLTGSQIQQIFIVPTSPAGITVTPSMVPVTLAPGGIATFQVTISGAAPGSTVVLRLAPSAVEPLCCSMEIRLTVPKQGQC
jgi:hypothetical protein